MLYSLSCHLSDRKFEGFFRSFSRTNLENVRGGFLFDTSAILYTNLLYIFLMLIPLHYKENVIYQKITKGIFVTTNLIVIIMSLMDTVYFQYTHRRTTASVFSEFKNEGNLGGIIGTELLNHWYLTLFAIAFGYALFKLYRKPKPVKVERMPVYYTVHLLTLGLGVYLCIGGMRGGFTGMVRPITISNANKYVDRPMETGIVLNTLFLSSARLERPHLPYLSISIKRRWKLCTRRCICLRIVCNSGR